MNDIKLFNFLLVLVKLFNFLENHSVFNRSSHTNLLNSIILLINLFSLIKPHFILLNLSPSDKLFVLLVNSRELFKLLSSLLVTYNFPIIKWFIIALNSIL